MFLTIMLQKIYTTIGAAEHKHPFDDNDFASLNSKYDIYDSAGYKLFSIQGNVYTFDEGSALNPAEFADGSYAVEITDDSSQTVGLRFTEVVSTDSGAYTQPRQMVV